MDRHFARNILHKVHIAATQYEVTRDQHDSSPGRADTRSRVVAETPTLLARPRPAAGPLLPVWGCCDTEAQVVEEVVVGRDAELHPWRRDAKGGASRVVAGGADRQDLRPCKVEGRITRDFLRPDPKYTRDGNTCQRVRRIIRRNILSSSSSFL